MPGITGMGTTYNLPNYTGELFQITPEDTPLLSAIGGLTGGQAVNAPIFSWQETDLRDADENRQRKEGAEAPEASARKRVNATNVLEIHQEAVDISYTKQAASGLIATGGDPQVTVGSTTIPASELRFQIDTQLKQIARDVERTFITGKYQNPADNTKPRKTRGLLEAIKTNTKTVEGELTEDDVLDLMQMAWENGGLMESETRTLVVGAAMKRLLSKIFVKDAGYKENSRNVGGVNLQTIETDFGLANIMLNRHVPGDTLIAASLESLAPTFMEIPGKGHFFAEPLAKTGASDKVQIYGEIGFKYGNERKHGKLTIAGESGN